MSGCDGLFRRKTQNTRREVLQALGAVALAASLNACAPMPSTALRYPRPYSRKPWVAPRISMDAVIREVVGHRPYRPSGFVVKSERFDDNKVVVHNYGHGGGGISLSWGSSALAVRETLGMTPGEVAVIGSGVMGLTSARLLQDAGWNVTVYTRDVARHTTSNVAAGEWAPFSVYDPAVATAAFRSQLDWAARISHHAYTNLGGADYGVSWLEAYTLRDAAMTWDSELADLFPHAADLGPDEHPFPSRYVRRAVTMRIEPAILLRRLTRDFQLAGGRFVIRNFADRAEILTLPQALIFNCTGLGAAKLFGDTELTPAKGQLVFLAPDPAVDYWTEGGGNGLMYMMPRSDVLLLGGTFKLGDYTTHPEAEETERIVTEHQRLYRDFG
jgi:glycine/D-amino acid oxidase-like deaminating enzyme